MFRLFPSLALFLLAVVAAAQLEGAPADHDALRKLKAQAIEAVNKRDYRMAENLWHKPFMATVITQQSFTDFNGLRGYFESLFTRDRRRLKSMSISAEADDLSEILTATIALTKGSTAEHYEMADGRVFDIKGRFTAVSIKEQDGSWKLLAVHTGTNFLENPVLTAVEKSVAWVGAGSVAVGLAIGFLSAWLILRRRAGRGTA